MAEELCYMSGVCMQQGDTMNEGCSSKNPRNRFPRLARLLPGLNPRVFFIPEIDKRLHPGRVQRDSRLSCKYAFPRSHSSPAYPDLRTGGGEPVTRCRQFAGKSWQKRLSTHQHLPAGRSSRRAVKVVEAAGTEERSVPRGGKAFSDRDFLITAYIDRVRVPA